MFRDLATVIYKLLLLAFGVLDTHMYYRYPSNMFFSGIICCSIVVVRSIRMSAVSLSYSNDFLFNCLSNFVQIYYYNIPIARVWKKYWKRHVLAHLLIVIVTMSYFAKVFLSLFQSRESETNDRQYIVRNCTFFHSYLLGLS